MRFALRSMYEQARYGTSSVGPGPRQQFARKTMNVTIPTIDAQLYLFASLMTNCPRHSSNVWSRLVCASHARTNLEFLFTSFITFAFGFRITLFLSSSFDAGWVVIYRVLGGLERSSIESKLAPVIIHSDQRQRERADAFRESIW
jgi:hypothetical protein